MKLTIATLAVLAGNAWAAPADDLAIETYRHLVSSESLLQGAIRSGDPNDYKRFIWKPASDMMHRWPPMGDPVFDKYARCRFAIVQYLTYSEDQFKAVGQLPKTSLTSKDYFEQRGECKKALKGKV